MVLFITHELVRLVNEGWQGYGQEVPTGGVDETIDTVNDLKKQIDQLQRDAKSHEAVMAEQKTRFEKQVTDPRNQIERMKEEKNRLEKSEKQNEAQCEKQITDLRNQAEELLEKKNNLLDQYEKEIKSLEDEVEMLKNLVEEHREANDKLTCELAEKTGRAEQATAASTLTTGARKTKKEAIESHAEARKILESSLRRIAWVRSRLEVLAKEAAEADDDSK